MTPDQNIHVSYQKQNRYPYSIRKTNNVTISTSGGTEGITALPLTLRRAFLEYVWIRGGDLPLIPQPILAHNTYHQETGLGCERVIPGFCGILSPLKEKIVHVGGEDGPNVKSCFLRYTVINPGIRSGYPVRGHEAEVTFSALKCKNDCVVLGIIWEVKWDPLPFCGWYVNLITKFIIGTLINNFGRHIMNGGVQQ